MDMAKAITNRRGGIVVEVGVGVKPRNPDRCPPWKIHTISPRTANSVNAFRTIALSGIRTLPVKRNNINNVANTMMAIAIGRLEPIECFWSTMSAAVPPTSIVWPGGAASALTWCDEVLGWPTRRDEVVLYLPVAHISDVMELPPRIGDWKTSHVGTSRSLYGSHSTLHRQPRGIGGFSAA